MEKILIATTNPGKFKEIVAELTDVNLNFVSLNDLKIKFKEVEEPHETTWGNAIEKARFFARKTGLVTIAEDTGLFIKALNGRPGVKTKRTAPTAALRVKKILKQLAGVPTQKRSAYFETSGCIYDPHTESFHVFTGTMQGRIVSSLSTTLDEHLAFSAIFYYPPLKKLLIDMSVLEKNMISHRGKVTHQLKYYILKNFNPTQIVCAAGIIVKDGKMLLTKRRDLRPEFNNKWEFPGGGVENGESFDETTIRELKEETGFTVKKIEQLPDIMTTTVRNKKENYQVHLYMSVCSIESGSLAIADSESSDYGWFTYSEAAKLDLLPLNKKIIQSEQNKKVLLKYIKLA